MTILLPIISVGAAVGGGFFVVFANGRRILYTEEFLSKLKDN